MQGLLDTSNVHCDPGPCEPTTLINATLVVFISTVSIYFVIFYILFIIASWRIFEKAGEKGWKALIPLYNMYIMYKIVGMKNWFWGMIALTIIVSTITTIDGFVGLTSIKDVQVQTFDYQGHLVTFITLLINFFINIYVLCVYAWRTSKIFGHGKGWAAGLVILPNIFWLMLGFGKSKYNKKMLKDFNHKRKQTK